MVRRSLIVLILVVSAFQLLGVMRVPTIAAALPSVPLALTQTAEPPTPVPPTAVPPTNTPVLPTAVPPTNTPVPPDPNPRDTATPEPPVETPAVPGETATVITSTEIAGGTPTPTPTPTPDGASSPPPSSPAGLPKTGEGSSPAALLWIGVAVLAVAVGGMLRRRSS